MMERTYVAIDLKSFYASVECMDRGLDPLSACLVVADPERTEKTICLAVSPALKAYGIPGRPRLFEVVQRIKEVNAGGLKPPLEYITAPPRMARYMEVSTRIYSIYMKYIAAEDMHVYSCDEVFMDVTAYLRSTGMSAHDLAITMIRDVLRTTGITATAGIGSNLYLCKIAMDIVAKHMPADADGVRIAELNERSYRELLWEHKPITDFWRIGGGTARRLAHLGLYTMGDVARYSEHYEDTLYKTFGVNAELLIDHAWGWEPCTIADIKGFRPENNSLSSGQVLQRPYRYEEAAIVLREMADRLSLELTEKHVDADQIVINIGYDTESLKDPELRKSFQGKISTDRYGRAVPEPAHGSARLPKRCASTRLFIEAAMEIYERTVDPRLLVRRMSIAAEHVLPEAECDKKEEPSYEQLDLFTDYEAREREAAGEEERLQKEKALQQATLEIHRKYGRNALLKGTDFKEGATARERNRQIGGHKA
ncbi:MAG: DNA methylase [Lachnospiraceae bacterium]|nr:DNA methylase [Lachnospiraceae bacterium]